MAINSADLAAARSLEATLRPDDDNPLAALQSVPAVLAYLATCARAEGDDEGDVVELAVRLVDMSPADARACASVLRAMGYRSVSDRLVELAGRRKKDLRPL